MLAACLIVILLCGSGLVLWWQRRSEGRLGAPPMLTMDGQPSKIPLAIVAVLGIAFPLVGLSLVTGLALDYFVISRIPALRKLLN